MPGGLNEGGWSAVDHGAGMDNHLLLIAWPYDGGILTSFRYSTYSNLFQRESQELTFITAHIRHLFSTKDQQS